MADSSRALIACALAVFALLVIVVLIARRSEQLFPVSDEAVTELATLNALDGRQLLGPYSRYPWHHPGPALFYLLAPFYEVSGKRSTGLAAGALFINVVGLSLATWVLFRRGGAALALALTATVSLLLARVPAVVFSPWNPHVAAILAIPVLIFGAAAAAGWPAAIPIVAGAASVALQTHIATLPLVAVGLASAALAFAVSGVRPSRIAVRTGAVLLAIWLLPLIEQFRPAGGNIGRLMQFAMTPQPGVDSSVWIQSWADALLSVFRPAFGVPLGLLVTHDPVRSTVAAALAEIFLLAAVAAWARATGRSIYQWIALELLATSVVSLWAVSRIPDGIHDHEVFWIAVVGALNAGAILAWPLTAAGFDRWPTASAVVLIVLLAGLAADGVNELRLMVARSHSLSANDRLVRNLTTAVDGEIARSGSRRTTILIDQRVWPAAAGVVLQLRKKGRPIAVEPDLAHMFSGTLAADGSEDLEVSFCGGPCHERESARPGNVVVWLGEGIAVDAIKLRQ